MSSHGMSKATAGRGTTLPDDMQKMLCVLRGHHGMQCISMRVGIQETIHIYLISHNFVCTLQYAMTLYQLTCMAKRQLPGIFASHSGIGPEAL